MGYSRWAAGELVVASKLNAMIPNIILQGSDITRTSSTAFVDTDITFTPDVSATYYYELFVSYGAGNVGDIKWAWSAAQAAFTRFAFSVAGPETPSGVDTGGNGLLHRPAEGTGMVAAGLTSGNAGFMSAWERGTFTTTSTAAACTLQVGQSASSATSTIFRGGNNSRFVYQRVV